VAAASPRVPIDIDCEEADEQRDAELEWLQGLKAGSRPAAVASRPGLSALLVRQGNDHAVLARQVPGAVAVALRRHLAYLGLSAEALEDVVLRLFGIGISLVYCLIHLHTPSIDQPSPCF
jgi:hypothetical protein